MKTRLLCLGTFAIAASVSVMPARAADSPARAPTQQEKFAACAHGTKGLKAEERRKFMSDCLKGRATAPGALEARNDASSDASASARIRECKSAAASRSLHGEERRAFMVSCLKG
jgi:hypothetical protein